MSSARRFSGRQAPVGARVVFRHPMLGSHKHVHSAYLCLLHQGQSIPQDIEPLPTMADLVQMMPSEVLCWLFDRPEPFLYTGIYQIRRWGLKYFISVKNGKVYDPLDGVELTLVQAHVKYEDDQFLACLHIP